MPKITLSKPILKDGNEIEKLELDFEKITGKEILAAEKEARIMGDNSLDMQFSKTFQVVLAAKAAKECVIADDLIGLPGPDFLRIATEVSNFLFGWALAANLQQNS